MADERAGEVVDNDEAVYLTTAYRLGTAVEELDVDGVGRILFAEPTPYAPLLSAASAPLVAVFGPHASAALVAQLAFFVVLVAAAYLLARRLLDVPWGIGVAAVVATCPFVVDYTRSYQFALASAALFTASLATLLASERFSRWGPSLGFGALLGATVLARTVMVAFAGVLLAVALLVWWLDPVDRAGRGLRLTRGLILGLFIAVPWYVANGGAVVDYLIGYGFGPESVDFGPGLSPWSPDYWLSEPVSLLREVYLPLAALVVVGLASAAVATGRGLRREGLRSWLARQWRSGWAVVGLTGLLAYLALSSSNNQGTGFLLPLVPLAVLAAAGGLRWWASHDRRRLVAVATIGLLVVGWNAAMKSGLVPVVDDVREIDVAGVGVVAVTDGRSRLDRQLELGDYVDGRPAGEAADRVVERVAGADPCCPTLAYTSSDYLLNGPRMTMAAAAAGVDSSRFLIVFQCEGDTVDGYRRQLRVLPGEGPRHLLTVDLGPDQLLPATDTAALEEAARAEGFSVVERYRLTDDREARLWRTPPGPVIPPEGPPCP